MKLLIDMNLSPLWVDTLTRHGWEAVHWSTVGDPHATDQTIIGWPRTKGSRVFFDRAWSLWPNCWESFRSYLQGLENQEGPIPGPLSCCSTLLEEFRGLCRFSWRAGRSSRYGVVWQITCLASDYVTRSAELLLEVIRIHDPASVVTTPVAS
jgi:hypothetical protein